MKIHSPKAFSACWSIAIILFACVMAAPVHSQGYPGPSGGGRGGGMGMDMGMGMPQSPLEQLKQSLQKAKTDRAKQQIVAKIKNMLSSQYDAFLAENETELQGMENRVKNLRAQLERRKKAKAQLLALELQRISNEADGLVWPAQPNDMGMGMGMGMGGGRGGASMGMGAMGGAIMGMGAMGGPGMGARGGGMGSVPDLEMEDTNDVLDIADTVDTVISEHEDQMVTAQNQIRQIGLAWHNFESAHRHLHNNITDEEGKPLLSWRVAILEFMGESEQRLYKKFKLDEPWDSKHNIQLLNEMPDAYKNASFDSNTKTVYLGFEGDGTMLESGMEVRFADVTDGSSNTILVAQMNRLAAIEWTKPADIEFEVDKPVTQLAESTDGTIVVGIADGSVWGLDLDSLETTDLKNLIRRNDGNVVDFPR